jgi:hypothetical protein
MQKWSVEPTQRRGSVGSGRIISFEDPVDEPNEEEGGCKIIGRGNTYNPMTCEDDNRQSAESASESEFEEDNAPNGVYLHNQLFLKDVEVDLKMVKSAMTAVKENSELVSA